MAKVSEKTRFIVNLKAQEIEESEKEKHKVDQAKILKALRAKEEEDVEINITNSIKRALSSKDEDENTLLEEVVAKGMATLKNKEKITLGELSQLQGILGESKTKIEHSGDMKINLREELEKISSEGRY